MNLKYKSTQITIPKTLTKQYIDLFSWPFAFSFGHRYGMYTSKISKDYTNLNDR